MNLVLLAAALFVVDGHADTPQFLLDLGTDLTQAGEQMVDLPKARQGALGGAFFSIWVDPVNNDRRFLQRALELIDAVRTQVERHPRQLRLALTAGDVLEAQRHRQLAVLMGLEGGHPLGGSVRQLRDMYRLGVRYMTLTWSVSNAFGDSSGDLDRSDIPHHNGLSPLGREAVAE